MRVSRRIVGTVIGLALVTASLAACGDTPDEGAAAPQTTQATTDPSSETPEDPTEYTGEGEDPATMEDGPTEAPESVEVDYKTLPGPCANDVPLPRAKHGIVDVNRTLEGECLITIDSQGDSLFMIGDIDEQLIEAGFTQTSAPTEDDSETAVNTASYRGASHEVHVTVTQDGVSGVIIMYALTDPNRGNG